MAEFKIGSKVRVLDNAQTLGVEPRAGQVGKIVGFDGEHFEGAIVHFFVDDKKNKIRISFLELA